MLVTDLADADVMVNKIDLVPVFTEFIFWWESQTLKSKERVHLFIYIFIFSLLAVLGLRCCAPAFSSCGERGLLFIVVHGLLIAVASLVAEHGL